MLKIIILWDEKLEEGSGCCDWGLGRGGLRREGRGLLMRFRGCFGYVMDRRMGYR